MAAVAASGDLWTADVGIIRRQDDDAKEAGVGLVGRVCVHGQEYVAAESEHIRRCFLAAKRFGVESLVVWTRQ
jgi:hypothetical protein